MFLEYLYKAVIIGAITSLPAVSITGCKSRFKIESKPNIVFILSDDLNWGDIGYYGQKKFNTPNIDRIGKEGIKFTNAYAGSAVCAPSRSALMEGKHTGHARIRDNAYRRYAESLQPQDYTVAMLLKQAGYKTGIFGKWGLAMHYMPGIPNNMGFDEFFGYLSQVHAHCYYPEFLWHNQDRIYYPENGEFHKIENYRSDCVYDKDGKAMPQGIENISEAKFSFDVYCEESLKFVRNNKNNPFFLFLAYTIPHGATIVPDLGEFKDRDWPMRTRSGKEYDEYKEYAAMVTRMDNEVGKLLNLLEELNLDDNTIIFFTSDNGSYEPERSIVSFFDSASPTRGNKGNPYNGAFHVPSMVRWPKYIKPNQVSDHFWAFWDFLPTVAELVGIEPPSDVDGISILPTLLGKKEQKVHEYLYWEFKQHQSIRHGNYFAYKPNNEEIELYDLSVDPQQTNDLSAQYPEMINKIKGFMEESHTPSDVWPSPGETGEEFMKRLKENNIHERYVNTTPEFF
jgi:arylsulfatase A-like enzyme